MRVINLSQRCIDGMIRDPQNPRNCLDAPEIYLDYTNIWALGALLFAGTGLVMTTIAMGKNREQNREKGSHNKVTNDGLFPNKNGGKEVED